MCTLQDMSLNQELNQSETDGRTYRHYMTCPHLSAGHKIKYLKVRVTTA